MENFMPFFILVFFLFYFIFRRILSNIRYKAEKLEELDGEFIFTFVKQIRKKEIYFNIDEVTMAILTKMFIKRGTFQTMNFSIFLVDGYNLRLRKKQDCLIFLKACRNKRKELYQKILQMIPAGASIISILEKELDNFENQM
ncbi:hypothetical protein [Leptotrichia sp. oral taxon 847]|uniref:hypothetical protein n=1 Tax=Leptotrichia sp. oral taxon 847 TaxID=1785996 RepID=UPI000AA771FB|nr:hypothetical protein [Leptotrichia sp. oral taxon 847]